MKKKKTITKIASLGILVFISVLGIISFNSYNNVKVNYLLNTEPYKYLTPNVKEYVKEVYKESGYLPLTEKNKQIKRPYLNPQYLKYVEMTDEEKSKVSVIPSTYIVDYYVTEESNNVVEESLPTKFDLRNVDGKNYIMPVRNQESTGLCWAFAAIGTADSHMHKKNNTPYNVNDKVLSPGQLDASTAIDGIIDYQNESQISYDRKLSTGGNFYIASTAFATGISTVEEEKFKPFNPITIKPEELHKVLNYDNSKYELNETYNFPILNVRESTGNLTIQENETRKKYINEVKNNIMKLGSATLNTYMNEACIVDEKNTGKKLVDVYKCNDIGGHAMEIIGWDDLAEYEYCADTYVHQKLTNSCKNPVKGKGAWLVKNSWGENSNPYLYVAYDSEYSEIFFIKNMTNMNERAWDNSHTLTSYTDVSKNHAYKINTIKPDYQEKLNKIKMFVFDSETEYKIDINAVNGNFTYTKKTYIPGMVQIDIPEDVILDSNSSIKISSQGEFVSTILLFTNNIDKKEKVFLDKVNNITTEKTTIRLYSDTRNIPSNTELMYKIYNKDNIEVTDKVVISNNIVSKNNINTLMDISKIERGTYRVDIFNRKDEKLGTFNMVSNRMDGEGTKENPYRIRNTIQFDEIRKNLSAYYVLENDLDFTEDTRFGGKLAKPGEYVPTKTHGWFPIEGFKGVLDGQNHTIKGIYHRNELIEGETSEHIGTDYAALFAKPGGSFTIKNLNLEEFDINCRSGDKCALLVSEANFRFGETTIDINISNISAKNMKFSTNGELFYSLSAPDGKIKISNIYLDYDTSPQSFDGYVSNLIAAKEIYIDNIYLKNKLYENPKYEEGYKTIFNKISAERILSVNNIFSNVTYTKTNYGSQLVNDIWNNQTNDNLHINNILMPKTSNGFWYKRYDDSELQKDTIKNINYYNMYSDIPRLTDKKTYEGWVDFDKYWELKTIDGIPRFPALKFTKFEYTNIKDIIINQKLNTKYNIYDYITPRKDSINKITFKIKDEKIAKILEDGTIIPLKSGKTTVHVESMYDGYIKDVPLEVAYEPHYIVKYDANGGIGTMEDVEVKPNEKHSILDNKYTKKLYVFDGWNTKPDGSGTKYKVNDEILLTKDKEEITLYAQWIGQEIIVNYDPGPDGEVNPKQEIHRYNEIIKTVPMPYKKNHAFSSWGVCTNEDCGILFSYEPGTKLDFFVYKAKANYKENAYNIIYDGNGGTIDIRNNDYIKKLSSTKIYDIYRYNIDEKISTNKFKNKDLKFKEWNTLPDGKGTSYKENDIINLKELKEKQLVLYAIWEKESNIENKTKDVETYYDGQNHTIKLDLSIKEYQVKYSLDKSYNLDKIPEFKDIGEYTINYKVTKNGYKDLIGSNKIKIYGIKKINETVKDNIIIVKDNSLNNLKNKIEIYSKTNEIKLLDSKDNISNDNIKTGYKLKIIINNEKTYDYKLSLLGDISGDGLINSADLLKVRLHLLDKNKLNDVYFIAGDINTDNVINSADLFRIRQHLLNKKVIS